MLTGVTSNKFLAIVFVFAFVAGFARAAPAQSLQIQDADAQGGIQTDGLDLSIGESEPIGRYCGIGAYNVYVVWLANNATQEAAMGAYDEYFNNCQCAKYGGSYCK